MQIETYKMQIRRKLYTRGSSFETTIPMPLLFSVDKSKKHEVVFEFDPKTNRWYVNIEENQKKKESTKKTTTPKKRSVQIGIARKKTKKSKKRNIRR